ncbi:MAG: hypothetical protein JF886_16355 [Candidatus Dormibacteraeota bacterium]|uniref:Transmembrane protein n=1 Tax=Candidatus Aeolococcus gillhamiae TaxID=3127015 RepID=A0A934K625_9BACT|nr:hypothetical protein [Candidatus Dormibacteraeota bacterium]
MAGFDLIARGRFNPIGDTCYAATRPVLGRTMLAVAEFAALLASVLLKVPLLIVLDVFLSLVAEGLLWYSRDDRVRTPSAGGRAWMRIPLFGVVMTVIVAFFGFAIGADAATDRAHPDAPLPWIGGVIGGVMALTASVSIMFWLANRQQREARNRNASYVSQSGGYGS